MATDGHQAGTWPAHVAARERQVHDPAHVVHAAHVLGDAHRPHEDGRAGLGVHVREARDVLDGRARPAGKVVQRPVGERGLELLPAGGVLGKESVVGQAFVREHLEGARQERDIATGADGEEVGRDAGPEDRAFGVGGHPVALEARLAHGVDDRDPGAPLAGHVEVLHEHGLRVRDVRPEQDDEVRLDDIGVGHRGRRDPERIPERVGRRRVTDARRVVHRVRPQEPGHLLGDVVDLVRDTPRRQVEAEAIAAIAGIGLAGAPDPVRRQPHGLIPRDAPEPRLAVAAEHGEGQTAELSQLGAG